MDEFTPDQPGITEDEARDRIKHFDPSYEELRACFGSGFILAMWAFDEYGGPNMIEKSRMNRIMEEAFRYWVEKKFPSE